MIKPLILEVDIPQAPNQSGQMLISPKSAAEFVQWLVGDTWTGRPRQEGWTVSITES